MNLKTLTAIGKGGSGAAAGALTALLAALGVDINAQEVMTDAKREAILNFVQAASLPSVNLIAMTGTIKRGGSIAALVIVSDAGSEKSLPAPAEPLMLTA
jgi:hypothetical protein